MKALYQNFLWRRAWSKVKRDGVWFVDIPRTSSSSIRTELAAHFGAHFGKADLLQPQYNVAQQIIPSHLTAREVREILGTRAWDNLFTFSVVRNPWARLKSMYQYRVHQAQIPPEFTFKEYLKLFFSSIQHPHSPYHYHGHYYLCVDYLLDHKGHLLVDHVIRFEARQQLKELSQRLEGLSLGKLNLNALEDQREYQHYYDEEDKKLVARWAQRDIDYFGYTFD